MFHELPTDLQVVAIDHFLTKENGVELYLLDLSKTDAIISGNKWFKLRLNIAHALEKKLDTLVTFGGAFSNHIHAAAKAAQIAGIQSVGIIRGEAAYANNRTLTEARSFGMQLEFVSRSTYREKNSAAFQHYLENKYGPAVLIVPEGGSNAAGVQGAMAINHYIPDWIDVACLPVGSGGTIAGIALGARNGLKVIGFAALKDFHYLSGEIATMQQSVSERLPIAPELRGGYDFGGFGKVTQELEMFMHAFESQFGIALDPVYTAKMMYGILEEIRLKKFTKGLKILAIHTGGLQGRKI